MKTPAAMQRISGGPDGAIRAGRLVSLAFSAAAVALVGAFGGCAPAPTPPPVGAPVPFADAASLVHELQAGGLALQPLGSSVYMWFDVPAHTYNVGGSAEQVLYVHQFPDAPSAAAAARRVSPDGSHVISSQNQNVLVQWMGEPHLYQNGRLLVVYVGKDQAAMDRLTALLGPQFAGATAPESHLPAAGWLAGLSSGSHSGPLRGPSPGLC